MPHADPDHRALRTGCAAALSGPRVAAADRGLRAEVRPLPGSGGPWHLADVRLEAAAEGDGEPAALRPALAERHTSRFPFTEERIPDGLRAAAILEGCRPVVPGDGHAEAVMGLVHASGTFEAADGPGPLGDRPPDPHRRGRRGRRDGGDPPYALGPRQYDVTSPVRDFDAPRRVPGRGSARFGRDPRIALLGTAGDAPREWLAAGQALHRVLLRATLDGLSTSLMSQPLEWPGLRPLARDPLSTTGFVRMVIRMGYGPRGRASRRPVSEVLRSV
ncbi:nitroreductase [Streptomyces sp. NPDC057242]|uniref:nitroreductase n=1 Tax=unclassified Streptomyces TaxID=2593676 RepID=UPI00362E55B7